MDHILHQHIVRQLGLNGIAAYVWDMERDTIRWAGSLSALLGNTRSDPSSSGEFRSLVNPQDVPVYLDALHRLRADTAPMSVTYRLRGEGGYVDVMDKAELQIDETGRRVRCGTISLIDAVAGRSGSEPSRRAANRPMAAAGRRNLWQHLGESMREDVVDRGFLLVFGIDGFSMMNDTFGVRFADEVLDLTEHRLEQLFGGEGRIIRIESDLFGLILAGMQHSEMPVVAQAVINHFANRPIVTSGGPVMVSISGGGAAFDGNVESDPPTLVARAEIAMQRAKHRGRSSFLSYDMVSPELNEARTMLRSGEDFIRALKDRRVRLAFQPVIDMKTDKVAFHESLIRMIGESGKLMAAGQFVPAIEALGMSRLIDLYALKAAIHELRLFSDLSLSVNVSRQTLADPEWLRCIVASLRDFPSVATRLIVEVTESAAALDPNLMTRVVRTLQDIGCRVALDDFGAGFTAFTQLRDLNVDIIKIDKFFIRSIEESQSKLFIRTLQMLADGVDVQTVGEGAETLSEARLMAADGVNMVQGYVFGFPQIERVWLPKDHIHRRETVSSLPADMVADIMAG